MKTKTCRMWKEGEYTPLNFTAGEFTIFRLSPVGLFNDKLIMYCYGWVDGSGCAISGLDDKPQVEGIKWGVNKKKTLFKVAIVPTTTELVELEPDDIVWHQAGTWTTYT